jgi:serine/threonine protein kinase
MGMILNREKQHFAMVSQWMDHGNIMGFVEKYKDVNRVQLVSEDVILQDNLYNPLSQLVEATIGLEYVHNLDVVHGDLKGVGFC